MTYGVIDIGSNSVRLMINRDGQTLYKKPIITKLGEGISIRPVLNEAAMERTVSAISLLYEEAKNAGADEVLLFATAAVRGAENGSDFVSRVYDRTGLKTDVISGKDEAGLGLLGALGGSDGGIIDVGGASTEITVCKNGKTVYAYSLDLGSVRLTDLCGQDGALIKKTVAGKIKEYGKVPSSDFYGIGGTATSLAAVDLALEEYDPNRVNGHRISCGRLEEIAETLVSMSVEERKRLKGLQPERAEVIACGALLLSGIVKMLGIEYITVSESDNLEGYLFKKLGHGRG